MKPSQMKNHEHQSGSKSHEPTTIHADDKGTRWINCVARVYGIDPYIKFEGDAESSQEFARFRWATNGDERGVYHLSISRSTKEVIPRFRVDLSFSFKEHVSSISCPYVTRIIPNEKKHCVTFIGTGEEKDLTFKLFVSGELQVQRT